VGVTTNSLRKTIKRIIVPRRVGVNLWSVARHDPAEKREEDMNYNLLEEKWIPVLWKEGNTNRVGIIEALTEAGRIRQIAASNPMDRVALLRFLLALLYWCKGNPPYKIPDDSFPPDWFKKLNDNRDCFNLLGEGKRFYQCMPDTPNKLSANYLAQEIPTGINFWHFKHATDKKDGLCSACCAMGLLRLPVFATSGGRGKPPGINAKPPTYVIPLGSSLAETLLLSWRKVSDLGTPAWVKPDLQLPKKGEVPLLTGLTWLPRRVWLDNPGEIASCITCGGREPLIRHIVFVGIGSQKMDDGDRRDWCDPHVIRDTKDKVVKPDNALGASDAAAGQWTKVATGILGGQRANNPRKVWVVGFATVQNDKHLEAMEYVFPFTCAQPQMQESIEKIQKWQKEGSGLAKRIRPRAFSRKHVEVPPLVASIRPHVETKVSVKAGELIAGDQAAWKQAASEYSPMMAAIAQSLSPGFTTAAVRRRRDIASVKPHLRSKKEAHKKPRLKKGGEK
jgi:hypothetical protein